MKIPSILTISLLIPALVIYEITLGRDASSSYYPLTFQDEKAVYFKSPQFEVYADGVRDDSKVLQQVIDTVEEKYGVGIVFIPSGRYCINETVYLWQGIRLIGYGAERPILVLPSNSPGFSDDTVKYMIHFCDSRPAKGQPIVDAKNTTFYSGISNINIEIQSGNLAAVGIRFRVAQLSSLEHIDFRLEAGIAAVEHGGNEIEDCRFFGGQYGIKTMRTSPGWQFLLMDCTFEGQEKAAILTHEAGMTIIRTHFKDVPHAVVVEPNHIEKLYVENCVCEHITHSVFLISEHDQAENQFNVKDIICHNCPVFLAFRKQDDQVQCKAESYIMRSLVHGLVIETDKKTVNKQIKTIYNIQEKAHEPAFFNKDFPDLPPQQNWVNVKKYGATGDGITDDTAAFQRAIAEHDVLYVPMGRYIISNTLYFQKATCLIGLHPWATHLALKNHQAGFDEKDNPGLMIITPHGGKNIISGLGFDSGDNQGAVEVKWMAGSDSYMDDVCFEWGSGAKQPLGQGDYASLWITNGGGGIFKNIWNVNQFKKYGLKIDQTTTKGRIYLMSVEHHTQEEVRIENVKNWILYDLQTEDRPGNEKTLSTHLLHCENIQFVNLFLYRSSSMSEPHPCGLKLDSCQNVTIRGAHSFSLGKFPYQYTVLIKEANISIADKEFAHFQWP